MNKLHVDSIQKAFDNRPILSDVYLGCNTGDIVGLIGRNGSGKSTLLQIIKGTLEADFKYVGVNGKALLNLKETEGEINFLPQHGFIPESITVKQAFSFSSIGNEDLQHTQFLEPILNQKIGSLSGGQRRIVEIAFILFSKGKFCLLDEPFSGLEPNKVALVCELIQLKSKDKGIIISDHQYRTVLSVTTKNYILSDQCLREVKELDDLVKYGYLRKLD